MTPVGGKRSWRLASTTYPCGVAMLEVAKSAPENQGSDMQMMVVNRQAVPEGRHRNSMPHVVRPVLLVHGLGLGGTTSGWAGLTRALEARGVTVATISYSPFGTPMQRIAEQLADEVSALLARTGADKVHLVGHSLGGVVIAQAFADGLLAGQVDTVVTIASPFGGSPWARLVPVGATFRALRGGSPLLRRLAGAPSPAGVRWLALSAAVDRVVPGARSVPAQPGVLAMRLPAAGHRGLLENPQVVSTIVGVLPIREEMAA